METRLIAAAVVLGVLSCAASSAAEIRFTGTTTANQQLIGDALRQLLTIADAKLTCTSLGEVVAEVLPREFSPPAASKVTSSETATYERWTATLCEKPVPFLVTFWEAPEGGTMFAVGYPFPSSQDAS